MAPEWGAACRHELLSSAHTSVINGVEATNGSTLLYTGCLIGSHFSHGAVQRPCQIQCWYVD